MEERTKGRISRKEKRKKLYKEIKMERKRKEAGTRSRRQRK